MVSTKCACGVHLHTAARIIAIKSMMYSVFKFCFVLFQLLYLKQENVQAESQPEHTLFLRSYAWLIGFYESVNFMIFEEVVCVALCIAGLCLFYGNRQHKPIYYWPFHIFSSFELCQAIFNLAYYTTRTVKVWNGEAVDAKEFEPAEQTKAFVSCVVIIAVAAVLYSLRTYVFLVVPWQARIYLEYLNNSKFTTETRMPSEVNLRELTEQKSSGLLPEP
ncbi:hypothetical protein M3Y99_00636500 [Aphelenchoides fujianensis]|nr:hypothetical protein M3Y99_00636500 [Aphelenchoides fujianensis]